VVGVAKKYRTKPRGDSGTWYEIEVITTRRLEWLRVTMHPGRYYQGGFPAEMARAIPGLDLAELEEID
jgi:hypothetical protein